MKKGVIAIALLLVVTAYGGVFNINFKSTYGVDGDSAGNPLLPNIGDDVKIQLIYAGANNAVDGLATAGGGTQGDDVLLEEWTFTNTGGTLGEQYASFSYSHNSAFQGQGYVFGRVFADSAAIAGSSYAEWTVQQMSDFTSIPLPTPEEYNFGGNAAIHPDKVVAIPEPGTMGMVGAVCVSLFMIRRTFRI